MTEATLTTANAMSGSVYGRELSPAEIEAKAHRDLVGGLWDEVGALQIEFLRARGLAPGDRLLDVGCGALRGGVHFVRYLEPGHYYGLDINASLIEAGRRELTDAGLGERDAQLLVDDRFAASRFGVSFDAALAVSVFTHLPANAIVRCLVEVARVLKPGARFFASWFEAPAPAWLEPVTHPRGGIVSHYDADPYHYATAELSWMAGLARLRVENLGDWAHPRGQHMAAFVRDE
jgi:SAM-dependent methyltransferase